MSAPGAEQSHGKASIRRVRNEHEAMPVRGVCAGWFTGPLLFPPVMLVKTGKAA